MSVTKLAATYLVCESKVQLCKLPYGIPNAWISLKMLCSPVLASFADSKLLDFSPASGGMTLRINRMLYVALYMVRTCIINPGRMRFRHDCKNATTFLAQHTGELSTDEAGDSGFISTLRVCMFSCHAMTVCILVVPFDSLA